MSCGILSGVCLDDWLPSVAYNHVLNYNQNLQRDYILAAGFVQVAAAATATAAANRQRQAVCSMI